MTRGTDREYDVAIIGAGPAGSSAAIDLARAGRRVLLIEKHQFPRQKVCGGCLSGSAAARLHALVGPGRRPPGRPGSRITFVIGRYRMSCDPRGATWIVPRSDLDACLADAAAQAGADLRYGLTARVESDDAGWHVVAGDHRIDAAHVLLASGLSGQAQRLGIERREVGPAMLAQQWVQPAVAPLPELGAVELHWLRGGYVGLATPAVDCSVVALAARTPIPAGRSAFDWLRQRNPTARVWDILPPDAPKRFAARGTAGFPWLPTRLGDRNLLLIGDAAGYAEPYSGEGIGQAMHSAGCAARAIIAGGDVLAGYTADMRRRHRRVLWRTRILSGILDRPLVHFLASRRPVLPLDWLGAAVRRIHVGRAPPVAAAAGPSG